MPISDIEGYEKGHFDRVYKHIIKPACIKAGFKPLRADDVKRTNYIVLDILKRIIESDIVLCDLSARNPNVLYELGIRQAFDKPVVLIKDDFSERIFDIQGLRDTEYDHKMRIDTVEKDVENIATALQETFEEKDILSLIYLLGLEPASIGNKVTLSDESSIILRELQDIKNRTGQIDEVLSSVKQVMRSAPDFNWPEKIRKGLSILYCFKDKIEHISNEKKDIDYSATSDSIASELNIRNKREIQISLIDENKIRIFHDHSDLIGVEAHHVCQENFNLFDEVYKYPSGMVAWTDRGTNIQGGESYLRHNFGIWTVKENSEWRIFLELHNEIRM